MELYRNGATSSELLEIIAEKTTEINDLKKSLTSKTDNLQKIAKSSSEVLNQYSSLQVAFNAVKDQYKQLSIENEANKKLIQQKEEAECVLKKTIQTNTQLIAEKEQYAINVESELNDSNITVEKLHKRCAELVAEKQEKSKQLDTERLHHSRKEQELKVIKFFI